LAVGKAGDAAEDGAERATENIGGFTGGKVNGLEGEEREAEGIEAKEQDDLVYVDVVWEAAGTPMMAHGREE
jgi:hypothetical protein